MALPRRRPGARAGVGTAPVEDGRFRHPDGRARFLFEDPRPLPEAPGERYPFLLLTGRGQVDYFAERQAAGVCDPASPAARR